MAQMLAKSRSVTTQERYDAHLELIHESGWNHLRRGVWTAGDREILVARRGPRLHLGAGLNRYY